MNQFRERKNPFEKEERIVDAASSKTRNDPNVDISLLSDEERMYYMRHGKLPVSQTAQTRINDFQQQNPIHEDVLETVPEEIPEESTQHTETYVNTVTDWTERLDRDIDNSRNNSGILGNWEEKPTRVNRLMPPIQDAAEQQREEITNIDQDNDLVEESISTNSSSEYMEVLDKDNEIPQPTTYTPISDSSINNLLNENNGSTYILNTKIEEPESQSIEENRVDNIAVKNDDTFDMDLSQEEEIEQAIEEMNETTTSMSELDSTSESDVNDPDTNDEAELDIIEEISDEEPNPDIDYGIIAPDENSRIVYDKLINDIDDLSQKYDLNTEEGAETFNRIMSNQSGKIYKEQLLNGTSTASRDFDQKAMGEKDLNALYDETPNEIRSKNSNSNINSASIRDPNKVVKGRQARMLITAKVRGTKKIFLYNSGFYVVVRPLTNLELSEYINSLHTQNSEYGRIMGGHFYLYASVQIKRFFADKLTSIVVDSNLQGWKQGNTLLESISLHDFRTLMWACAALMYKDGVEFTKICSHCQNVEKATINLDKLCFHNFDAIKDSAYPYIMQKKSVTTEDIAEYRNRINFGILPEIKSNNFKFKLHVPSLHTYLEYADMFMGELLQNVHDNTDIQKVQEFVRYTHFKQYTPWISEIDSLDDQGELQFKIVNNDDIFANIADLELEGTKVARQMEEYIQKTMLTYIAFPYMECPKCHKVPENITNGFVAYDVESAFFTMSVRKSRVISSQLEDSTNI